MHLALFDLYDGGHHYQYVRYLAEYWAQHVTGHRLDVVVPRPFVERYPEVQALCAESKSLHLVVLDPPDFGQSLLHTDAEHGRLLQQYARAHRPDHIIALYFDHLQVSLARRLALPAGTTVSGIYFRPSFHYGHLAQEPLAWKERLQRWRKRLVLRFALRHPACTHLFSLDPFVVPYIEAMRTNTTIIALPDGVEVEEQLLGDNTRAALRQARGIESGRYVALVLGVLSERKGVFQVLEAVKHLHPDVQRRLCLWLAGKPFAGTEAEVEAAVQCVRDTTQVQVVMDARFLDDDEFQPFLHAADLSLVLYQQHIGSSNILIRSALAGRPVLASEYGLVGALTRAHTLGRTVPAGDVNQVAAALTGAVTDPDSIAFDAEAARAYAEANGADRFAHTVFAPFGVLAAQEVAS